MPKLPTIESLLREYEKHFGHEFELIKTGSDIEEFAGRGLRDPGKLTPEQTRKLCGSVLRHIEREAAK